MAVRLPRAPLAGLALVLLALPGCGSSPHRSAAAPTSPLPPASTASSDDDFSHMPQDELLSRRPFGRAYTHQRCTRERPCRFVARLGPTASEHRFIAWDTPQRYARTRPLFIEAWADDQPVPFGPVGSPACGLHFVLRAVVVGVASFCADGHQPIHFRFTNVTKHQITITLGYYALPPTPPRTPARPTPAPKPDRTPAPKPAKPPAEGPFSPL
jgi:hypothetical protein